MSKIPNSLFAANSGNTITLGSAGGSGGSGAAGTISISSAGTINIIGGGGGGTGGTGGYSSGTTWASTSAWRTTSTSTLRWLHHNKGSLLRLATLLGIKNPKLEGTCFYDSIRMCTWAFSDGNWYKVTL